MLDRIASLRAKLAGLSRKDTARRVFGARSHGYALRPVIAEQDVASFEAKRAASLPSEYRAFLTELGNGGAGPFYGVYALGEVQSHKVEGFNLGWSDVVGDLAKPFPHVAAWNGSDDLLAAVNEGDDEADAAYFAPVDGAFPIAQQGCGLEALLVVTGPEAGNVWHDARADHGGLVPWGDGSGAREAGCFAWRGSMVGAFGLPLAVDAPLATRVSFLDWYDRWLALASAFVARCAGAGV